MNNPKFNSIVGKLLIFCLFIFTALPFNKASAFGFDDDDYCRKRDCERASFWETTGPALIGGAALGAAVGAGAAAAICGKKKGNKGNPGPEGIPGTNGTNGTNGAQGPIGPTGPSPFVADTGETLTFTFSMNVTAAPVPSETFIPYVMLPDGTDVPGPAVTVTTTGSPIILPIPITNPPFGTYFAGVMTEGDATTTPMTATLQIIATATRDGSVTLFANNETVKDNPPNQAETNASFVYDSTNVP